MRAVEIVEVLPFLELGVEDLGVVDDHPVEFMATKRRDRVSDLRDPGSWPDGKDTDRAALWTICLTVRPALPIDPDAGNAFEFFRHPANHARASSRRLK